MVTIYAFTCTENGKAYIGCTAGKIAKRFREHRCLLASGKHSEPDLLADWKEFGPQSFRMEMVFEMEDDASMPAKRAMEKFAMARYKAAGLLYNRNESCFEPTEKARLKGQFKATWTKGKKYGPEANEKRRIATLGVPKGHGAKISATKKLLGQRPSLEAARLGGLAAARKKMMR